MDAADPRAIPLLSSAEIADRRARKAAAKAERLHPVEDVVCLTAPVELVGITGRQHVVEIESLFKAVLEALFEKKHASAGLFVGEVERDHVHRQALLTAEGDHQRRDFAGRFQCRHNAIDGLGLAIGEVCEKAGHARIGNGLREQAAAFEPLGLERNRLDRERAGFLAAVIPDELERAFLLEATRQSAAVLARLS